MPYGGVEFEMVENGKTGFLVERDNLSQLKDLLELLLKDENLRNEIGQRAQAKVKVLSIDNMVDNFIQAIEFVLK